MTYKDLTKNVWFSLTGFHYSHSYSDGSTLVAIYQSYLYLKINITRTGCLTLPNSMKPDAASLRRKRST